jgi:heme-degrading monooxygenase HmoA
LLDKAAKYVVPFYRDSNNKNSRKKSMESKHSESTCLQIVFCAPIFICYFLLIFFPATCTYLPFRFLHQKIKEAIMFARLTFIKTATENAADVKRIYIDEVIPVVRSQKGNIGCWLLEPTNKDDDYISLTEWTSAADADAYEASGVYRTLVDKIKDYYSSKPVLKTYNITETKIASTAKF